MDKQIKEKVEKIGISLKKWGLHIYRGILTGLNEAFIISKQERDELISQDPKSADLIRPILRGKDIKRYRFEYKDLYLICTFPSLHITIDSYPSIKAHLLKTGKERLSQTGMLYVINGKKVKARKKTNNKWFETQDTISYWDDFSKPKIIYPCIMRDGPHFMLDIKGEYFTPAPGNIITGTNLYYLIALLCSQVTYFILRKFYMGGGIEGELKTNRLEKLPLPIFEKKDPLCTKIEKISKEIVLDPNSSNNKEKIDEIDLLVSNKFGLSQKELEYIKNYKFN